MSQPIGDPLDKKLGNITLRDLQQLQATETQPRNKSLFPLSTRNRTPSGSLQWPNNGSVGMIPAGKTVFDLEEGEVRFADGGKSQKIERLQDNGVDYASSMHLHPFFDSMSVTWIGPETSDDGPSGVWMDNQHHVLTGEKMTQVEVWTGLPVPMFVEWGFAPERPPLVPDGLQNPHTRADVFAPTPDSWTGFVFRPSAHNPREQRTVLMDRDRAQSGNPVFGARAVGSLYTDTHTIVVQNTGSNPIDVRVRGAMRAPDPQNGITIDDVMVPDPSTGSGGITGIQPGGNANITVDQGYLFLQAQVKNSNTGAPSAATMGYWGLAGV